jgi:hypothetical protein
MLPFRDRSFDLALAAEVIEHLPDHVRKQALAEMARVARTWVLLTVPNREVLERAQVCCAECGCIFHRYRHTASFDEHSMASLLSPEYAMERTMLIGAPGRQAPGRIVRLAQLAGGYAAPGNSSKCPMCGNSTTFLHKRTLLTRLLIGGSSRLRPQRRGNWLAVLYGRVK